jgi:hypothetical protein
MHFSRRTDALLGAEVAVALLILVLQRAHLSPPPEARPRWVSRAGTLRRSPHAVVQYGQQHLVGVVPALGHRSLGLSFPGVPRPRARLGAAGLTSAPPLPKQQLDKSTPPPPYPHTALLYFDRLILPFTVSKPTCTLPGC